MSFVLAALLAPTSLLAQVTQPPVQEGDRVRVLADGARGVFTVIRVDVDTLTLESPSSVGPRRLGVHSIRRLHVNRGPRSVGAGALRGAGMGLGVGAITGAIFGLASGDDEGSFIAFSAEQKALVFGVTFGLGGAALGGVLGAALPGERWERVSVGEGLSLVPTGNGALAVSYSYRF